MRCNINSLTAFHILEADVGVRTHWWHVFIVIIPENMDPDYESHGFIWVVDSTNTKHDNTGMPDEEDEFIIAAALISTGVGIPCALLYQVCFHVLPNLNSKLHV